MVYPTGLKAKRYPYIYRRWITAMKARRQEMKRGVKRLSIYYCPRCWRLPPDKCCKPLHSTRYSQWGQRWWTEEATCPTCNKVWRYTNGD